VPGQPAHRRAALCQHHAHRHASRNAGIILAPPADLLILVKRPATPGATLAHFAVTSDDRQWPVAFLVYRGIIGFSFSVATTIRSMLSPRALHGAVRDGESFSPVHRWAHLTPDEWSARGVIWRILATYASTAARVRFVPEFKLASSHRRGCGAALVPCPCITAPITTCSKR
jgi:hypothetical protein